MTQSEQPNPDMASQPSRDLESFDTGAKRLSVREFLSKPLTIVAAVLSVAIAGLVVVLQQDPAALTLAVPEARYEILPNRGVTEGVPIAVRLGPLTVFTISDPLAGGGGAARSRQVVENLNTAVSQLVETPGRVITIETGGPEGMPSVVQKERADSAESLPIVQVSSDDMTLAGTDDPKLLARIWAERLTDSLRLLLFGDPPEFSRDSPFGGALDTLWVTADAQDGALTTEALSAAFEELSDELRKDLVSFPELPAPAEP